MNMKKILTGLLLVLLLLPAGCAKDASETEVQEPPVVNTDETQLQPPGDGEPPAEPPAIQDTEPAQKNPAPEKPSTEDKKTPDRKTPVVPPGSLGLSNMKRRCSACQLCVSACPNNVLRPSNKLATFMQPEMSFERGYCRPECVECSLVCPAGAITPITTADKSAISIGYAVWIKDSCIVNTDDVPCNSCERHCPTVAITFVDRDAGNKDSLKIPVVNKELCIGCGACESLCPARPYSAIYIEGNLRHHTV